MIEFKNIYLSFNGKAVIQNLSLEINQGEKIVILGKSGSGKSSLLSLALGFIKPDSGKIILNKVLINEKTAWSVRKKIAYIDQDVSLGTEKIIDTINFISKLKTNIHLDFSKEQIIKLLNYFELPDGIIEKNVGNLSGGERQRLAIVISILLKRDIFFLDEITAALDKNLKKKVADYFCNKTGATCVVISHDPVWLEHPSVKIFNFEEQKWEH